METKKSVDIIKIPMLKILVSSTFLWFFMACGGGDARTSSLFAIELDGDGAQFQQNETVAISIRNKRDVEPAKVSYSIDGRNMPVKEGRITLDVPTLGNKVLKATIDYGEKTGEITKKIKVLATKPPEVYTYEILNEYPHDNRAYTQGLEFHNDTLYEGTGKKGRSSLRKVNFATGEVLQRVALDETVFGEGITILDNKIYQLTWRGGMGYVYSLKGMERIDSFQYDQSKEGWGLANDGDKIYKSDGTEKIWFLNPATLVEEGHIETVTDKSIFNRANELEYVDGKIYANVYQKPSVMIIDASSGAIEGVVNFGGLSDKVTKGTDWSATENVLNGIAYHPGRKTFFVTGKDWDKLFEVVIKRKDG